MGCAHELSDALALSDCALRHLEGGFFRASVAGIYLTAIEDGTVAIDRPVPAEWETFRLISDNGALAMVGRDRKRFAERVIELNAAGQPVKVQVACGLFPERGFLNVDFGCAAPEFATAHHDEYFVMQTVGVRIPVPDDSVDYIFHEDFIEHIDQLSQLQFLAETLRILRPGAIHRVNTPDLMWAMRTYSRFDHGWHGVYTGEREWDHVGLLSKSHLKELALMVGYSEVRFTAKSKGTSPYAIPDKRPFGDRDEVDGNIYADLVK